MSEPALAAHPQRERIRVRGQVQGVGFRPVVYRLATELGLSGWVRNDGQGVLIELEGVHLERFVERLSRERPPLARIDSIEREAVAPTAERGFHILDSGAGPAQTAIVPDTAVCPACLSELFEPTDRRYRYPFINCTHCGPRYTITRGLPYDRSNTSMAAFPLCPRCEAEYRDPTDRRFHAQPNACEACGPRLRWAGADGRPLAVEDPIGEAVRRLRDGEVLAVKGLGGFHLACDARQPEAVARLRARKHREEKPLAVMAANAASLAPFVFIGEREAELAGSPQRPIVLMQKRPACDRLLAGAAPGIAWLGVMLPYTPLHYLLFHEAAGRPAGTDWLEVPQPLVLVMTSANPSDEPLVIDDAEAVARLAGIADGFLLHDRPIVTRCDDSVLRLSGGAPAFLRRGRGYTPEAIRLPRPGPSTLATGGWFKNTVCVTRGDEAFLSQHIGDLDNPSTCRYLEESVAHLCDVLQVNPERIAHDLHPDFHSTRLAGALAVEWNIPAFGVQHHHAHIAAVAAEHGQDGRLLGLALDGVGLGEDGTAWGGELLSVDGAEVARVGSLLPLALPGGDRAAREPWRMAASALHALGRGGEIARRFPGVAGAAVAEMLDRDVNCPRTGSMGRWFDAAAGLLGVRKSVRFEGQAAMLLEGMAARHGPVAADPSLFTVREDGGLDLLPLLARLADDHDPFRGAALFHATVVEALAVWVLRHSERTGDDTVAFGGGCFLNRLLSEGLEGVLCSSGVTVLTARRAPPNDGGLSLGQAWVGMNVVT